MRLAQLYYRILHCRACSLLRLLEHDESKLHLQTCHVNVRHVKFLADGRRFKSRKAAEEVRHAVASKRKRESEASDNGNGAKRAKGAKGEASRKAPADAQKWLTVGCRAEMQMQDGGMVGSRYAVSVVQLSEEGGTRRAEVLFDGLYAEVDGKAEADNGASADAKANVDANNFSPELIDEKLWVGAAAAGWRDKPLFADWTERALQRYLEHGLRDDAHGVTLACAPEVEAAIFGHTGSIDLYARAADIDVPVHIVRATEGRFPRGLYEALAAKMPHGRVSTMAGGHLLPMEVPEAVAELLLVTNSQVLLTVEVLKMAAAVVVVVVLPRTMVVATAAVVMMAVAMTTAVTAELKVD